MLSQVEKDCLLACNQCETACLECASACLKETEPARMVDCIKLDMECADVCRLAAASIARSDKHVREICSLCAAVCKSCTMECTMHLAEHCQRCAEACQRCSDACNSMTR
jgi:predicted transcriptional regulator